MFVGIAVVKSIWNVVVVCAVKEDEKSVTYPVWKLVLTGLPILSDKFRTVWIQHNNKISENCG